MFSVFSGARSHVVILTVWTMAFSVPGAQAPLRVCADPNNLPFSNEHGDGFENKIATLVARELHRPLKYFWIPQRRGFVRNSLNAGRCDRPSISGRLPQARRRRD